MRPTPPAAEPPDAAAAASARRGRVWLADDSAWELAHVRALLADAYEVETFPDGASLLERLAGPDVQAPDLLLLDWHMPGVSGLEVCRFLRERFSRAALPILVLTASTHEADLAEAFRAGVNDFVSKPARAPELLARVGTLFETRLHAERLQASEARYRALFESIDEGYCLMQLLFDESGRPVDYRFLETNAAFEGHTGLHAAVGRTARELVPTLDASWFELYGRVALTGQSTRFENAAPAMGRTFEVFASRVGAPEQRQVALVFKDITARKAAEAERERLLGELRAAHLRLSGLIANAPAFVATVRGPDHVFELVNPPYQRLMGVGRPLVGLPVREALPEMVAQGFVALLDRVYQTGEPLRGDEVAVRADRRGDGQLEDAYVNFLYQPARDASGAVVGIDAFAFDVTEQVRSRRRVEALAARLQQSEERLLRVAEATGTGIWEMDSATGTLVADARLRELLYLSPDEPVSVDKVFSLVHPDDRPRVEKAVAAALAGQDGGRYLQEYRTVHGPGARWRWVEARGRADFGPDGKPVRLLGTGLDVTARKEAEAARDGLLESLVGQPVFGVTLMRGERLVFERANETYRQTVGGRDVEGRALLDALPELAGQGFDTLLQDVQRTGVPHIGREVLARLDRRGDGVLEEAYFNFVFQPVRRPGAALADVLILTHDVTEIVNARKEAERLAALERQRAGFEQQLIGIVSHDLRNPVASIMMGASTLLRRPDLEERQRRTAERILNSAGRANRMIHDLLDFTQARLGGGLKVQRSPGDLHAIVRQVVEESQVTSPERTLRLQQTGDGAGAWDADRLSQLVGNLLSNALHYSPHHSTVSVETRGEPGQVLLTVHNTGEPIAPDVLPRLFQPLQRGEEGVSAARSVGLGLYIVDQVVRAHEGSIEVRSTQEEGTTFTVRLPRAARAP